MIFKNFKTGNIEVKGVEGHFTQIKQIGGFTHIHHVILNDDGIGCKKRVFVGGVCRGNYASEGIKACGNPMFGQQVAAQIEKFVAAGKAA